MNKLKVMDVEVQCSCARFNLVFSIEGPPGWTVVHLAGQWSVVLVVGN